LYASFSADGAIAEIYFWLGQEPVFPSKFRATLYELSVSLADVIRFDDIEMLEPFGVARAHSLDAKKLQ
jgi:hypothetical protein